MKFSLSIALLSSLITFSSFAETQEIESLRCSGANGLKIELVSKELIRTKLGFVTKEFGTTGELTVFTKGLSQVSRIKLTKANATNVFLYDIYLNQAPKRYQPTKLSGVIGNTVYSVAFPVILAPVPVPVGFVAATTVTCDLLTK